MLNHRPVFPVSPALLFILLLTPISCGGRRAMRWTHFSINSRLPGNAWGTGSIALDG